MFPQVQDVPADRRPHVDRRFLGFSIPRLCGKIVDQCRRFAYNV